jgi:HPr kinase/phosphorylase
MCSTRKRAIEGSIMGLCHATCIIIDGCGVLIRGPSGSGKSDLALRLIDEGAALVADDYCQLSTADGRLTATCPAAIKGKLEVRGIGIVSRSVNEQCTIGLVVDLMDKQLIERMPENPATTVEGVTIACFAIDPFCVSATAKVRAAVGHVLGNGGGA